MTNIFLLPCIIVIYILWINSDNTLQLFYSFILNFSLDRSLAIKVKTKTLYK